MRLLRIFLIAVVISIVGAFASTGAEDCIVDGTPDLKAGSESFCKTGYFEKIHAEGDETRFFGYMVFNDAGMALYQSHKKAIWAKFAKILEAMHVQSGALHVKLQFRYGGDILSTCVVKAKQGIVVCEDFKGTRS